jgi:hypothetical protein
MSRNGIITELLPDGKAKVTLGKTADCECCPSASACLVKKDAELVVLNTAGAVPGNSVIVQSKGLFKAEVTEILPCDKEDDLL